MGTISHDAWIGGESKCPSQVIKINRVRWRCGASIYSVVAWWEGARGGGKRWGGGWRNAAMTDPTLTHPHPRPRTRGWVYTQDGREKSAIRHHNGVEVPHVALSRGRRVTYISHWLFVWGGKTRDSWCPASARCEWQVTRKRGKRMERWRRVWWWRLGDGREGIEWWGNEAERRKRRKGRGRRESKEKMGRRKMKN